MQINTEPLPLYIWKYNIHNSTMNQLLVISGIVALGLSILASLEAENFEILLLERNAAMPKSRAQVFKTISDLTTYPEWFPGTDSFEEMDNTPMSIGKHFREVYQSNILGEVIYDNVITGYESPNYISFVNSGIMKYRVEMEINRRKDSANYPSEVIYRIYTRHNSVLFKYACAPVFSYWLNELWVRPGLFRLRYYLESNK